MISVEALERLERLERLEHHLGTGPFDHGWRAAT